MSPPRPCDSKNRAMQCWDWKAHARACEARSPLSDFINPMTETCQNANNIGWWHQPFANRFCGDVEKSRMWWEKRDLIYWAHVRGRSNVPPERYIKQGPLHDNTQWMDDLSQEERIRALDETKMITEIMIPMKKCLGFRGRQAVWAQPIRPGYGLEDPDEMPGFFSSPMHRYYDKVSPVRKAKEKRAAEAWFAWVYEERVWAIHWKEHHPEGPGFMALNRETQVGKGLKRAREE